jgi:hypothetical protein
MAKNPHAAGRGSFDPPRKRAGRLEQSFDLALVVETDGIGRGHARQTWHRHDFARDHHHELGAGRQPHLTDLDQMIGRRIALFGIGREGILRLGHADRQMAGGYSAPRKGTNEF